MVKNIFIITLAIVLSGCSLLPTKTEFRDRHIPIPSVPKPPDTERPILRINTITDEQWEDLGIVVQAYAISLQQSMSYASYLEQIIERYRLMSQMNVDILQEMGIRRAGPMPLALESDEAPPFSLYRESLRYSGPAVEADVGTEELYFSASGVILDFTINQERVFEEIHRNYINSLDDIEEEIITDGTN